MKKKYIFIGIIVIILLFVASFFTYNAQFTDNKVNIGGTNFTLPEGYHEGLKNELGATNITNGTHTVFISKYNDSYINKYKSDYYNYKTNSGKNVSNSSFTVESTEVFKSSTVDSSNYWFLHRDNVYTIYSWENNPKMDTIVFELVQSMK